MRRDRVGAYLPTRGRREHWPHRRPLGCLRPPRPELARGTSLHGTSELRAQPGRVFGGQARWISERFGPGAPGAPGRCPRRWLRNDRRGSDGWSSHIENTPGALAQGATAISDAGVNIAAATCVGPAERAELHSLVPDGEAAKHALAISHVAVTREREVVVVDVEDRPGVLPTATPLPATAVARAVAPGLASRTRPGRDPAGGALLVIAGRRSRQKVALPRLDGDRSRC